MEVATTVSQIELIVERIFLTHRIDRQDQTLLMSALLSKNTLTHEDRRLVERIFNALHRGELRVA